MLTGISAATARTLVTLNLNLSGVRTLARMDQALRLCFA
jgi:hypothetical protein